MKLGDIGEEMVATAIALAKERDARIEAIFVVRVPREFPLEGELPADVAERADASLEEARRSARTTASRSHATSSAPLDRPRDRRRGASARCRPDRARLVAALAPAVAVLLADGRPRAPQRAVRGARRRVPRGRLRGVTADARLRSRMKAVVIGCGRVGSAVAKQLAGEGWDVTCVDENEDALARLGAAGRAGSSSVMGWTSTCSRRAGIADADAAVVATDGDNTNIVIGQVAQKRYGIGCVVVRVLDPARAEFYAERGLRTVCPTQTAISSLARRRARVRRRDPAASDLMYIVVAGGGKVGSNVARSLLAMGHEVTLIEQRRDRFERLEEEFGPVVLHGDATEIVVLERAGIARPPDLVLAVTGDDEDNLVISQIAQGGLRRREGDRPRQRPAQPAALRPARDHADGVRDVRHPRARRARGARARARAAARARRRASRWSRCRSAATPRRRQAGRRALAAGGIAARLGDARTARRRSRSARR